MIMRGALLAGAAAILTGVAAGSLAQAPIYGAMPEFVPPIAPLTLTRTVYRSLADGKELVVSRRYAIRFTRIAGGYRLDGELLDAQVSAPLALASLAEIERKRVDLGLFPAMLDEHGIIQHGAAGVVDSQSKLSAVGGAKAAIFSANLPAGTKLELTGLTDQVAEASNGTAWPAYLFNPGSGEHLEARKVNLPDGSSGSVEVRVRAEGRLLGGLPKRVERVVTTQLSGTVKSSREVWTLSL